MFEKRLKEISKKLEGENKEFYILTHKKHRREIYFQNNSKAIKFIKIKFINPIKKERIIKRILYLLVKLRLLQPFLKKINLPSGFGNVIFVGGQIKGFDFKKRKALSFPLYENQNNDFLKQKEFQNQVAKKGFAPEIFKLNKKIPFSEEELLSEYKGGNDVGVFKKLFSFYEVKGIKSISLNEYTNFLRKKLKGSSINNSFIIGALNKISSIYSPKTKLRLVLSHGDFAREQVLLKKGSYVFVDWVGEKDIITRDLIKFLRGETHLFQNKKFKELIKHYPPDVKKNIKLYFLLNEIYSIIRANKVAKISRKRIKGLLE